MKGQGTEHVRERGRLDIFRLSFGMGFGELLSASLASLLNYYYVRTMGLSDGYFLLAQTVYAIYNAINDPLIGYVTNRRFRFTEKLGKTTPFIMAGGALSLFMAVLVYSAPLNGQLGMMLWMLGTLCLCDTFYSMFYVNYTALLPVVVRGKKQRVNLGTGTAAVSTVCMLLGFILPEFGDITKSSGYLLPMLLTAAVGLVLLVVLFPSVREEPALTRELLRKEGEGKSFFELLKLTLRLKNFICYILVFLSFQVLSLTAIASLPYFAEYVMGLPLDQINSARTMLILVEFVGVFASLPVWSKLAKRYEFRTILGICGVALSLSCLPMFFLTSLIPLYICFFLLGLSVGGFWSLLPPVFNDVLDEVSFITGTHDEGVFAGIRTFFARGALVIQSFIYFIVRGITGINPEVTAETATGSMRLGIRFEMFGIGILMILATSVLFLRKYDLTGQKLADIRYALDTRDGASKGESYDQA